MTATAPAKPRSAGATATIQALTERSVTARERERESLRLRRAGATYAAIGRQLGISAVAAIKAFRRALARLVPKEEVEAVRQLEIDRLDSMLAAAWPIAMGRRQSEGPGGAEELFSPAEQLAAIATCLKVAERRARLLGLDRRGPPLAPAEDARAQTRAALLPVLESATVEELTELKRIYEAVLARQQRGEGGSAGEETDALPSSSRSEDQAQGATSGD